MFNLILIDIIYWWFSVNVSRPSWDNLSTPLANKCAKCILSHCELDFPRGRPSENSRNPLQISDPKWFTFGCMGLRNQCCEGKRNLLHQYQNTLQPNKILAQNEKAKNESYSKFKLYVTTLWVPLTVFFLDRFNLPLPLRN